MVTKCQRCDDEMDHASELCAACNAELKFDAAFARTSVPSTGYVVYCEYDQSLECYAASPGWGETPEAAAADAVYNTVHRAWSRCVPVASAPVWVLQEVKCVRAVRKVINAQ